jgi:hypothetical protein
MRTFIVANDAPSAKRFIRGTGLLHWLAGCPRLDLRNQSYNFATCLLTGVCPSDGRRNFQYGEPGIPHVDVNECLRVYPPYLSNSTLEGVVNVETPMHSAVFHHWKEMVVLLIKYGGETEKVGVRSGMTPYGLAKALGTAETTAVMERYDGSQEQGSVAARFDWWEGPDALIHWDTGRALHQVFLHGLNNWYLENVVQAVGPVAGGHGGSGEAGV